jgi:hypothetical protein
MFRDIFADRYEVRVRFTEALMWEWEIRDVGSGRLIQTSASSAGGRFLSSRDAHDAGCARAEALPPVEH